MGVREVDSSPNLRPVHTIVFPKGSLTDLGSNTVQVTLAGGGGDAEDITYDNGVSGLSSTNVQDALDEIVALTPGGPGLNFSPVASDFDTPNVISGSVTVNISDLAGGSAPLTGFPRNFLSIDCTDPTNGTTVLLPVILPSVLPDRFKLNFGISLGSAPPEDIVGGFNFTNAGLTKSIGLTYNFDTVVAPYSPTMYGGNIAGPTVNWSLPSGNFLRGVDSTLYFDSVQPFAVAAPQLQVDYEVRTISPPPTTYAKERFYGSLPSSGNMTTDLIGETLKNPNVWLFFPTGFVGTVTFGVWIDIQRHPEDNI